MRLEDHNGSLYVRMKCKGVSYSEEKIEKLQTVYEGVPVIVDKLLER